MALEYPEKRRAIKCRYQISQSSLGQRCLAFSRTKIQIIHYLNHRRHRQQQARRYRTDRQTESGHRRQEICLLVACPTRHSRIEPLRRFWNTTPTSLSMNQKLHDLDNPFSYSPLKDRTIYTPSFCFRFRPFKMYSRRALAHRDCFGILFALTYVPCVCTCRACSSVYSIRFCRFSSCTLCFVLLFVSAMPGMKGPTCHQADTRQMWQV